MNQSPSISRCRQSFYAYLVTAWLMLGAWVCYAVFTPACHCYLPRDLAGILPHLLFTLPLFPFIASVMGLISGGLCWKDGDYLLSVASFALGSAFIPLWWGVWYALYGRHNPAGVKFLRP